MAPLELIALERVACGHGGRVVVAEVSFSVAPGEIICLLGPNGVGKTTLFKTILRLLPLLGGRIRVEGVDSRDWSARRFASVVGYVPQAHAAPFPFAVRDVVAMGRAARLGPFSAPSRADLAIAERALTALAIEPLAERPYTEISGGERQLTLIARALAQEARLLVMDEPTSNLDYGNQLQVLDHVRALAGRTGLGVVMTTHDPNHALLFATRAATLDRAGRFRIGPPETVVTTSYLRDTYHVRTRMMPADRPDGTAGWACLPLGREGGG